MAKQSQLEKAIENLVDQITVLQKALEALQEQRDRVKAAPVRRTRKAKTAIAEVKAS